MKRYRLSIEPYSWADEQRIDDYQPVVVEDAEGEFVRYEDVAAERLALHEAAQGTDRLLSEEDPAAQRMSDAALHALLAAECDERFLGVPIIPRRIGGMQAFCASRIDELFRRGLLADRPEARLVEIANGRLSLQLLREGAMIDIGGYCDAEDCLGEK